MMSTRTGHFELVRIEDGNGWQKVSGEMACASPHVQIETARYLTPMRREEPVTWTIAHRKAAVAIAPVLEDGRFVLVSQERIPVHRTLWEFPAGQIDVPVNEVTRDLVEHTAIEELREEIGGELTPGGTLEPLGWFFTSQGFTQEHVYFFLAKGVQITGTHTSMGGEHIHGIRRVTARELRDMVASNEINTGPTLALYAKLSALGHLDA